MIGEPPHRTALTSSFVVCERPAGLKEIRFVFALAASPVSDP